jgi:hypothetical protein
MTTSLQTPLGSVRMSDPPVPDVRVDHVLVNPRPEAIRIQLIGKSENELVVVASATLDRDAADRFLRAVSAGIADEHPGVGTLIVG